MKKVAIAAGGVILLFVVVVAMQPSTFRVERSIAVKAPADVVYAQVSDFKRWSAWSPWEKIDPNMEKIYEGEPGAVGSKYAWKGNDDIGSGSMTVTEASPPNKIVQKLEFIEPFEAVNTTSHTITAEGDGVKITWAMEGENNFISKAFGLFMNMDAMVGGDFEKGLEALKTVAEESAAQAAAAAAAAAPAEPAADDAAAGEGDTATP